LDTWRERRSAHFFKTTSAKLLKSTIRMSLPWRREARSNKGTWTPAFAGVTTLVTSWEAIKSDRVWTWVG